MTKSIFRTALCTSSSILAAAVFVAPVSAQDAVDPSAPVVEEGNATIVVTGSRVRRPDLEASSPTAVVGNEEFALQGTANVEDVLNDFPQVVPATTGTSNNPGGGVATVDLRGLGTQRTLVLVDGRRYVNFDPTQVVDLNTIPSALIERVDVVTGGQSAVYGSDAIAGVVNFVMKDDFEGFEFTVDNELSHQGDGHRYNIGGTIGTNFADGRGNVVVHASYYNRDAIFAGDRDATTDSFSDAGDGTIFPGGSSSIPGFRFSIPGFNELLGLPGTSARFDENGNAIAYDPATDLYNFGPVNYLQVPQERYLIYSKASYEVSEHFRPYVEGQFVNNRVSSELAATPIGNTTPFRDGSLGANLLVQTNSPFLGAETQAALNALDDDGDGYVSVPSFGRRFLETGARSNNDDRNAFRIVAGARGDIAAGWEYDTYYMFSRTKNAQVQNGNIQLSALLGGVQTAFLNPATGETSAFPFAGLPGGGTLVCADGAPEGCVPVNIFGPNNVSADAAEYLSITAQNQLEATTSNAAFVISNSDLVDIGGGPVGVALGIEYRKEAAEFIPDTFLSSGDVGGFNAGNPTKGSYDLTEFFGEIVVPVLADMPFARRLEFTGAARYSMYSNAVNNVFTWAAGGQYEPLDGLTFRGQYQKAIRGPSVDELFGGQTVSFDGAVDPCSTSAAASGALRDACIANGVPAAVVGTDAYESGSTSFPALQGGNPDLREERAKTWTVGGVFSPSFFRNFSLTVDYYNITIDDVIGTVGAQNIVDACLRFGEQSYCDLIERSSTGEFQRFVDLNFNAASLKTSGVDITANLNVPVSASLFGDQEGSFNFNFYGSRLISLDYVPVVGLDIENECAGRFGRTCSNTVAFGPTPKWRHTARVTYDEQPISASLLWRFIGSSRDDDDDTLYGLEKLDSKSYFDLSLGFVVSENLDMTFVVRNLFDTGFQPGASTQQGGNVQQSNTFPATYDTLGRYYSLGGTLRF